MDNISSTWEAESAFLTKKPRLDTRASCSRSSRFLAFSQRFKLKFVEFMESYSRVGIYSKKDVLPDDGCRPVAVLDGKDVLESYQNFKRFDTVVDVSDHLFANAAVEEASRCHSIVKSNNNYKDTRSGAFFFFLNSKKIHKKCRKTPRTPLHPAFPGIFFVQICCWRFFKTLILFCGMVDPPIILNYPLDNF
ncbi:hypothetical protein Hanom_Chr03g00230851 [Helianthus anomalus]